MSIRRHFIGAMVVSASALASSAALADIVNGDFEQASINGLTIPGWTIWDGKAQRLAGVGENHFGRVSSDPTPQAPGFSTLRQKFTATDRGTGDFAQVDFDVLGGQILAGGQINVIFYPGDPGDGDPIGLFIKNNTLLTKPIAAQHYSYKIGAIAKDYTIEIFVTAGTTSWIDVDNFVNTNVPTPGTLAMALGGMASSGLRRRRH
ncbi:MAG: hypothetical protein K8R92_04965 [Planctomycetes bacterium]|nr:hypothetical protein [Planctomycetota bacterium]